MNPGLTGLLVHLSPLLIGLGVVYATGSRMLGRLLASPPHPDARLPRAACHGTEDEPWTEDELADAGVRRAEVEAYTDWLLAEDVAKHRYEAWVHAQDGDRELLWSAYVAALDSEELLARRLQAVAA